MKEIEWQAYFDDLERLDVDNDFFENLKSNKKTNPNSLADLIGEKKNLRLEVLATNRANKPISFIATINSGRILFLPIITHEHSSKIIVDLARQLTKNDSKRPEPEWLKDYILPGENDIHKEAAEYRNKIIDLEKKLEITNEKLLPFTSTKRLLYEQSTELENAVRDALVELGFDVTQKSDRDWIARADGHEAIIEVTGHDNDIDIKKARQLLNYWLEESKESDDSKRAILIANHYIDIEPGQRGEPFTEKTLTAASTLSFTLVTTTDLYNTIHLLREGKIDASEIRKKILTTDGLCKLP